MILQQIITKKTKLVIGLMSGTSTDGVDAVLAEIEGHGTTTRARQLYFISVPYSDEVRGELLKTAEGGYGGSAGICKLNFFLGDFFADVCEELLVKAGRKKNEIDFVGSHGHTIFHIPEECGFLGKKSKSTLQIGEASLIAERLGCTVISDFRVADIAAGGQGAPLVPYTEFLLYRDALKTVALQNIGGIGNITVIPKNARLEDVFAFDTGPGNMVMDAVVFRASGASLRYDDGGRLAAQGRIDEQFMKYLLDDPYVMQKPPKTTGRERYGDAYVERICAKGFSLGLSYADILACAARFTAESIALAVETFCPLKPDCLIIGGGGSKNPFLIDQIKDLLPQCEVLTNEQVGRDSDAKEALAFAILANETVHGFPNNVPSATGAHHQTILGKISFGV